MGRGILNIVIGAAMIIGGLSGNLVLRGTSSGGGLAVLGFVVVGIGLYRVVQSNNQSNAGGGGGSDGGGQPPPQS
jgi:hypothetical protein